MSMKAEYVWSPLSAGFYPTVEKDRLVAVGSWLDDGVDITAEEYAALFPTPPGKYIDTVDSRQTWIDMPPMTLEQQQAAAKSIQSTLRAKADDEISWRQDAVNDGYATEREATDLAALKKYRVLLMRIDTSKAPGIEWPTQPDSAAS